MGAAVAALLLAVAAAGCGGGASTVTSVETHEVTVTQTVTTAVGNYTGTGSVMPNLNAAEVGAVEKIAADAYRQQWGDGSGVTFTWGPNIVGDWALVGLENVSGTAGKDVLLHKENGAWQVKDVGHGLITTWGNQTPAELWPN